MRLADASGGRGEWEKGGTEGVGLLEGAGAAAAAVRGEAAERRLNEGEKGLAAAARTGGAAAEGVG